jgi:protein-disulfide isomerase
MCIISYGINFALLFCAWIIRSRFSSAGFIDDSRKDFLFLWLNRLKSIPILSVFFVAVVFIVMLFPAYWKIQPPSHFETVSTGITPSGYPWIGSENAVLEITEFADYQCFQCKKMHFFLRQLIAENPGKVKIIHRHYPMDHEFNPIVREPFHVGSGKLALLAVYAASKNKFWQMNDLLYGVASHKKPLSTKELAKILDLDSNALARSINDQTIRYRVKHDIYHGNKLGITGTPAFLINGEVYQGQIPPEIIKMVLE